MSRSFTDVINDGKIEAMSPESTLNHAAFPDITTIIPSEPVPDDSGGYILIPLLVLFGILFLSALVYLMARNRRRLERIYIKRKYATRLKHDNEYDDDSDAALLKSDELDDPTEYLLNGKLEIENRYNTYTGINVGYDKTAGENC